MGASDLAPISRLCLRAYKVQIVNSVLFMRDSLKIVLNIIKVSNKHRRERAITTHNVIHICGGGAPPVPAPKINSRVPTP